MIEDCVTYDSSADLQNLNDDGFMYTGRMFSIGIMKLDGVFSAGYYTAILVKYEDRIGFLVMFDDSKKEYLSDFKFIDLCYVTSYTMFSDTDQIWYERFMRYLKADVVADFISRYEIKNGDVSISINNSQNVMTIKHQLFEVVIG